MGGTVGNACAILLRRAGIDVDLVEIDPEWSALGSGITLRGNALRVLDEVGVWPQVQAAIVAAPPHMDQRHDRPVRPRDRCRRHPLGGPRPPGHRRGAAADRDGVEICDLIRRPDGPKAAFGVMTRALQELGRQT